MISRALCRAKRHRSHTIAAFLHNHLPVSHMTTVDVSKLTYAELLELTKKLDQEIAAKRTEEFKVIADGIAKKVEAAGFTVAEVVIALQPYMAKRAAGKVTPAGAAAVLYRDPANPENTWSGRGRAARWLADYEAKGRKRDEFKV